MLGHPSCRNDMGSGVAPALQTLAGSSLSQPPERSPSIRLHPSTTIAGERRPILGLVGPGDIGTAGWLRRSSAATNGVVAKTQIEAG